MYIHFNLILRKQILHHAQYYCTIVILCRLLVLILIFLIVADSKYSGPNAKNGEINQLGNEKNRKLSGSSMHMDDNEYHLDEDMEHIPDHLMIDYDDPIFYKQPSDAFVIKNQPATLHCRVSHALDVHFKVCKS